MLIKILITQQNFVFGVSPDAAAARSLSSLGSHHYDRSSNILFPRGNPSWIHSGAEWPISDAYY